MLRFSQESDKGTNIHQMCNLTKNLESTNEEKLRDFTLTGAEKVNQLT